MGDDGTAVGDELLGVPLPFGLFRLQAENLKGGGGGAAHLGDGWTAAPSEKATGQGQSVVRIRASHRNAERLLDGIDSLFHLICGSLFLGVLGNGYRSAVQKLLVGVDVEPAGWRDRQGIASHAPLGGSTCSNFVEPGHQQSADLLFIHYPLAQRGCFGTGVIALHDRAAQRRRHPQPQQATSHRQR